MFFHSDIKEGRLSRRKDHLCFKPFQGCFSILTWCEFHKPITTKLVSNPSRDVFPFWLMPLRGHERTSIFGFQTLPGMFFHSDPNKRKSTSPPSRFQTLPGMFFHSDKISRWCFRRACQAFQTLPGMFFHSDDIWCLKILVSLIYRFKPFQGCFSILTKKHVVAHQNRIAVSNPSRDVFPFWPGTAHDFTAKWATLVVSNPSRDVFPFWLGFGLDGQGALTYCFKPFQGCFSILTIANT